MMLPVVSSFTRQILFPAAVTLSEHYRVTFGERRRPLRVVDLITRNGYVRLIANGDVFPS